MKKLTLILAVIMVLAMVASVSVCAKSADEALSISSTEVKKGTPKIDGFYDKIYDQSACVQYTDCSAFWGTGPDLNAKFNFLWDDNYFYMFGAVTDPTVCSAGDKYIFEDAASNPWQNDAVETWFVFDDAYCCKVHNDAYGKTMFVSEEGSNNAPGYSLTNTTLFDVSKSQYKCTPDAANNQYTVEVAFKLAKDYEKFLAAGKQFNFAVQVNNIPNETGMADVAAYGGGTGLALSNDSFTFSSAAVEVPADDPADPADDPADDTPTQPVTPVTADAGIVVAVAVMAVAAGVVLSKKH